MQVWTTQIVRTSYLLDGRRDLRKMDGSTTQSKCTSFSFSPAQCQRLIHGMTLGLWQLSSYAVVLHSDMWIDGGTISLNSSRLVRFCGATHINVKLILTTYLYKTLGYFSSDVKKWDYTSDRTIELSNMLHILHSPYLCDASYIWCVHILSLTCLCLYVSYFLIL